MTNAAMTRRETVLKAQNDKLRRTLEALRLSQHQLEYQAQRLVDLAEERTRQRNEARQEAERLRKRLETA